MIVKVYNRQTRIAALLYQRDPNRSGHSVGDQECANGASWYAVPHELYRANGMPP